MTMDESLLAGMHENIKFDRKYTMDISQMKVKDFSLGGYTTTTIDKDNGLDRQGLSLFPCNFLTKWLSLELSGPQ